MRRLLILFMLAAVTAGGAAQAATGTGARPPGSCDDMQQLEYNIGRIAIALDLCRRFSMSQEMQAIANLTPYGKLGMDKMRNFDGISGCGSIANNAEGLLGDKAKVIEYLKIKYDCSTADCIER